MTPPPFPLSTGGRRVLAAGRYVRLVDDDSWEYAERCRGTGVVGIIAVTSTGELVLTEQYRKSVGTTVVDIPAGLVGDDSGSESEAGIEAARRELLEETGWQAEELELIARCPTSPGITSEIIDLYRARGIMRVGAGGGDEHEQITVHVVPLAGADAWLESCRARGAMIDVKVYAALYFAR